MKIKILQLISTLLLIAGVILSMFDACTIFTLICFVACVIVSVYGIHLKNKEESIIVYGTFNLKIPETIFDKIQKFCDTDYEEDEPAERDHEEINNEFLAWLKTQGIIFEGWYIDDFGTEYDGKVFCVYLMREDDDEEIIFNIEKA